MNENYVLSLLVVLLCQIPVLLRLFIIAMSEKPPFFRGCDHQWSFVVALHAPFKVERDRDPDFRKAPGVSARSA
jgi:hypothetical protein